MNCWKVTPIAFFLTMLTGLAQAQHAEPKPLSAVGEPLPAVHQCLSYVDDLVSRGVHLENVHSLEDIVSVPIRGKLLTLLNKVRSDEIDGKTKIGTVDPQVRLQKAELRAKAYRSVRSHHCGGYFLGAISEAVIRKSGGANGALYMELSKEGDDDIAARLFSKLIENENVRGRR